MAEAPVEIYDLGKHGILTDPRAYSIDPAAWSDGRNIRFTEQGVQLIAGDLQQMGTLSDIPEFLMQVPALGVSYWFYFSLGDAYVYENGVHTKVTRNDGAEPTPSDVSYTATEGKDWNGTLLMGTPVFNNGIDVPQWWPSVNVNAVLEDLPDWPSTLRAKVIRAFGPYLFALNLTDNTARLPSTIQWSHKADPGTVPSSWDYTSPTVDAGRLSLTDSKGGEIVDGLLCGEQLIIYKENSFHAIRFIGGTNLFGSTMLSDTIGLLGPRCACAFGSGHQHFVLGQKDIITHNGTQAIQEVAERKVKNRIYGEMDTVNYANSHVFHNPLTREVWVAYPTEGNVYPNRAAIWDYVNNHWTFRDFTGVCADVGALTGVGLGEWDDSTKQWNNIPDSWGEVTRNTVVAIDRTIAFAIDTDYTFNGASINAFIERRGIPIDGKGRDGQPRGSISSLKLWKRLWPKLTGGPVNIHIGVQQTANRDEPIVWQPPQFFTPGTDRYIDFTVQGRLLAIRYESNTNQAWTLEGHDLTVVKVSDM